MNETVSDVVRKERRDDRGRSDGLSQHRSLTMLDNPVETKESAYRQKENKDYGESNVEGEWRDIFVFHCS